nr:TonB-dependent receptor [Muribaculaceae bacterium]
AVRCGSFDLLNPSALIELQLRPSVNASLSGEWISSSGKYRFRYRRVTPGGDVAYDTTAVRQNGDIEAMRLEMNINGSTARGEWHVKGYHYNSERGIPGAIVNNVWRRGERQWDNNSFVQGSYNAVFDRFSTLFNVKYAFYRTHYVNNDDRQLQVDNLYRQREMYVSTANSFRLLRFWHVSASYDFQWNSLTTDMRDFKKPDRYTHMLSVATAMNLPQVRVQASAAATFIDDRVGGKTMPDRKAFTPAVFASVVPVRSFKALELRAFYKHSFRMPTFNDLYYADMGNSRLDPERAVQYNGGAVVRKEMASGFLRGWNVNADAYLNYVTNKIVAYPKGQQFRWTMLNLGRVRIKGIDLGASATVNPAGSLLVTLRGQYTFQEAIDITDPTDSYYRDQIPYIPRHSGSAVVNASWRGWGLNYSFIYVGERYNQQENILYNYTEPWYTSDVSLSKDFSVSGVGIRVLAEINNLLSQDYDVIANYPMPKRNFRFTFRVEL